MTYPWQLSSFFFPGWVSDIRRSDVKGLYLSWCLWSVSGRWPQRTPLQVSALKLHQHLFLPCVIFLMLWHQLLNGVWEVVSLCTYTIYTPWTLHYGNKFIPLRQTSNRLKLSPPSHVILWNQNLNIFMVPLKRFPKLVWLSRIISILSDRPPWS